MIWPVISTSNSRHLNELFSSLKCPENFWAISTAKLEQNQLNLSTKVLMLKYSAKDMGIESKSCTNDLSELYRLKVNCTNMYTKIFYNLS